MQLTTQTQLAAPLYYLTQKGKIGLFVKRDNNLYILKIDGREQTYLKDTLAYVPAEKIQLFKKLGK